MTTIRNFWTYLRMLFLEGMMGRTLSGERLSLASRRMTGSNFMLAGICGLVIGIIWFAQRAHFEATAIATTAIVKEVTSELNGKGYKVHDLTLRWTVADGTDVTHSPSVRSSTYDVPVGSELAIKYDPAEPSDVRVERAEGPWFLPCLFLLGGILTFGLGRLIRGRTPA